MLHLNKKIIIVAGLGLSLAACSTLPSELKAKYEPHTLLINGNKEAVANCLMPYMDEVKFYITAEPRYCHKRIISDMIEIFAADEGYTLYVIDLKDNSGKTRASLYSGKGFNGSNVHKAFENAAAKCGDDLTLNR